MEDQNVEKGEDISPKISQILGEAHLVGALKVMSRGLKRTGSQWSCLKDRADVLHGPGSGDDASD